MNKQLLVLVLLVLLIGAAIAGKSKKDNKTKKSKKFDKVADVAVVQREHEAKLEAVWKQHKAATVAASTAATGTAPKHALSLIEATEAKIAKTKADLALLERKLAWLVSGSAPASLSGTAAVPATTAASCTAPATEMPVGAIDSLPIARVDEPTMPV